MSQSDLSQYLTPAAKQMLDELQRDFADRLLLGAADAASRATPELREISVADLARSYERMQPDAARWRRSLVERLVDLYALMGLVTGAVGFLFLFIKRTTSGLADVPDMVALAIAGSGFSLIAISWLLRRTRTVQAIIGRATVGFDYVRRPSDMLGDTALLIRAWSDLEVALREIAAHRLGESAAQRPVAELISLLQHGGALSAEEVGTLRHFAQIRNSVVHGRDPHVRDISGVVADLRAFTHKLGVSPSGAA